MWVRTQERDLLINLNTGLRLAIVPNNKKEGEDQLYAVLVQTPVEFSQPLTRSLPTGYNNTVLLSGAAYMACLDLLELIWTELNGWQVPAELPYHDDQPETCILRYTDHHNTVHHIMCEDEITAMDEMHQHVIGYWPQHSRHQIPPDPAEAIQMSEERFGIPKEWEIIPAIFVRRIVERGRGK